MTVARAYTAALVGDPRSAALHAVTEALALAVGAWGRSIAGDYLEKVGRDDPGASFHIGCFVGDALVDLIKCPATAGNLAAALSQAARVVWVACPDEIGGDLRAALAAASALGIQSHGLVLNSARLDPEVAADEELLGVLALETDELLADLSIDPELRLAVSIGGERSAAEAESLGALVSWLFDSPPAAAAAAGDGETSSTLEVERSYGVQGPAGRPSRVAFGPVTGRAIAAGDRLTLLGGGAEGTEVAVSEVQLFGEKVDRAPANASAALLLHGAPKGEPKTGQVLTSDPGRYRAALAAELEVAVAPGRTAAEELAGAPALELHFGFGTVSAQVTRFTPDERAPRMAQLAVKLDREAVLAPRRPVLVVAGSRLVAGGWLRPGGEGARID